MTNGAAMDPREDHIDGPDWTFENFGPEFDNHALKHLPHYHTAHEVVCHAASFALPPGGTVADLGCSTGYAIHAIGNHMPGRQFTAFMYDADHSMLDMARRRLGNHPDIRYDTFPKDLTELPWPHDAADVTLCLWTLQFLPPHTWFHVLQHAHRRASPDGLLLLGAKTRLSDARWQEIADGALADWKDAHGVTPDEALTKARSLRGTMTVVPVGRYWELLDAAGWHSPAILFRWNAWVIIGAWANPLHEYPERP